VKNRNDHEDEQSLLATWRKYFQNSPLVFSSSVTLVVAYFVGAVNLWGFSWFIGRPDVFMQSLDVGPGLLALMASSLISLLLIIGFPLIPSLFFFLHVKDLKLDKDSAKEIAWRLFIIFAGGLLVFVVVSAFSGYRACLFTAFIIPVLVVLDLVANSGDWVRFFTALIIPVLVACNLAANYAKENVSKLFLFLGLIVSFSFFMALDIVFSKAYMTAFYDGGVDVAGDWDKFSGLFFLSLGAVFPGIFFVINAYKGPVSKVKHAVFGVLGYIVLLGFTIPKIFGVISADSMALLGINEQEVRRYLIDAKQYPVNSLDDYGWAIKEYDYHSYSLDAVSLYEFGAVNLLCPADLSKKNILKISSYTHRCIPFRQDAVRKLDALVEYKSDGR